MAGPDPREKRAHTRTELVLKVEYEQANDLLSDYILDLGKGGLFISTSAPFAIGQELSFAVSFPGIVKPIQLRGVVRWRRAENVERLDKPPGVGVEFIFSDDERRKELDALLTRLKSLEQPQNIKIDRPFRVLLVEDNTFTQDLFQHAVKRFHQQMGMSATLDIVQALNATEAMESLNSSPVDLAIIDYYLPVMTGAELIRKMRANPAMKCTPVMVISVGGEGVREDALAAGADLYVDKPVLLKQLLNTLHVLMSSRTPGEATP